MTVLVLVIGLVVTVVTGLLTVRMMNRKVLAEIESNLLSAKKLRQGDWSDEQVFQYRSRYLEHHCEVVIEHLDFEDCPLCDDKRNRDPKIYTTREDHKSRNKVIRQAMKTGQQSLILRDEIDRKQRYTNQTASELERADIERAQKRARKRTQKHIERRRVSTMPILGTPREIEAWQKKRYPKINGNQYSDKSNGSWQKIMYWQQKEMQRLKYLVTKAEQDYVRAYHQASAADLNRLRKSQESTRRLKPARVSHLEVLKNRYADVLNSLAEVEAKIERGR